MISMVNLSRYYLVFFVKSCGGGYDVDDDDGMNVRVVLLCVNCTNS